MRIFREYLAVLSRRVSYKMTKEVDLRYYILFIKYTSYFYKSGENSEPWPMPMKIFNRSTHILVVI